MSLILHRLLKDGDLIDKIEATARDLRQDQYGREESTDNHTAITLLHHIGQILKHPDNWQDYLKKHNDPPLPFSLHSNTGIAETLFQNGIINHMTAKIIIRDDTPNTPKLKIG